MQVELDSLYSCVAALDVHLNKIVVCVIRTREGVTPEVLVREFGGFKRDRCAMAQWIADFAPQSVAMESTGIYWKSPYAALERVGIRAKVVNAQHVAKVEGRKTDICDAQWLAMLTRAGLLRGSFIAHQSVRHLRLITRYHDRLTSMLGTEKNRLLKVLGDGGLRLSALVSDPHGKACRTMVALVLDGAAPEQAVRFAGRLKAPRAELQASLDHELSDIHCFVAHSIREHIEQIEQRRAQLEQRLFDELRPLQPLVELLLTVPGMDRLGIAKLLVEIGPDMTAFATPGRLAAWCGLCPGNDRSAGKQRRARTLKGNPYVRRVLIEMANAAVKTQCYLREKYRSLVVRMGHKRAIVAIAHKLIRLSFLILSRRVPYQDRSADFEALRVKRNAPRWLKQLIKHGHLPVAA